MHLSGAQMQVQHVSEQGHRTVCGIAWRGGYVPCCLHAVARFVQRAISFPVHVTKTTTCVCSGSPLRAHHCHAEFHVRVEDVDVLCEKLIWERVMKAKQGLATLAARFIDPAFCCECNAFCSGEARSVTLITITVTTQYKKADEECG